MGTVTGSLTAKIDVSNQTGRRLAVRLRALPDSKGFRPSAVDVRAGDVLGAARLDSAVRS